MEGGPPAGKFVLRPNADHAYSAQLMSVSANRVRQIMSEDSATDGSYVRQNVGFRRPTFWRLSGIDALFRKGLKKQGFLVWVFW